MKLCFDHFCRLSIKISVSQRKAKRDLYMSIVGREVMYMFFSWKGHHVKIQEPFSKDLETKRRKNTTSQWTKSCGSESSWRACLSFTGSLRVQNQLSDK